jgi:hypothetical protein
MDQEVAKTLGELEIKLQELERELTSIGRRDTQPGKSWTPSKLVDEAIEGTGPGTADAGRHAGPGTTHTGQHASPGTTHTGQHAGPGGTNTAQHAGSEVAGAGRHDTGELSAGLEDERERAVDSAFGGPAVFGGEEVPAQSNTIERDSAFPVSETAYGEIATGSPQPPAASFPLGVFSQAPGTPTPQPGPPIPPPGPPIPSPGQPPVPPSVPPTPAPQPPPPQPIDRAELVRFKEKLQRTMEDLIDEYAKLLLPKPPA